MALPLLLIGLGMGALFLGIGALLLAALSGKKVVLYGPRWAGKTEFVKAVKEALGKDGEIKIEATTITETYENVILETEDGESPFFSEVKDLPGGDESINEFLKAIEEGDALGIYFFAGYQREGKNSPTVRLDEDENSVKRVNRDIRRFLAYFKDKEQASLEDIGKKFLIVATHCDLDPDFAARNTAYYTDQFSRIVCDRITKVRIPLVAGSLCGEENRAKLVKLAAKAIKNNN